MQVAYRGQFTDERWRNWIGFQPLAAHVGDVVEQALAVVSTRSDDDLDRIAHMIESRVAAAIRRIAKPQASGFLGLTESEQIVFARRQWGDVSLWLRAGDARSPTVREQRTLPAGVTRAEYLATIALWKALELREVTKDARPFNLSRLTSERLASLYIRIAELTAETTRAAMLAAEAELVDRRIAAATGKLKAELDEINRQRKKSSSAGGLGRAKTYAALRERIRQVVDSPGFDKRRPVMATRSALFSAGFDVSEKFVKDALKALNVSVPGRAPANRPSKAVPQQDQRLARRVT